MIEIKKGQIWIHKFGLRNASKEKIEIILIKDTTDISPPEIALVAPENAQLGRTLSRGGQGPCLPEIAIAPAADGPLPQQSSGAARGAESSASYSG